MRAFLNRRFAKGGRSAENRRRNPRRNYLRTLFINLLKDESGVTAIEYGLIAGLIAVAAISAFTTAGTALSNRFSNIASKI
jgi:pilus assembly protein Flp/PilA